ncbi:MAG: DNA translocase FtsK 4TM domain-containing protein, partial [Thermoleophilia bacterium]|nr:DNA translocase FtsK 4TM domain-containing protein [Thermoleophilia bacterium]
MAGTARKGNGRSGSRAVKTAAKSPPGKRRASSSGRRTPWHSRSERTRELVALVLFGIAAFLLFVLTASEKGGVVGRGMGAGLDYAFGKLAFVVPLAFIAAGILIVFAVKVTRSTRFWGVIVFLVGLFLLMGGTVPPFDDHGGGLFVRVDFEERAGALGEAFYAGVHGLLGIVGVGIIGWILVVVGFSMVTGFTALWLGRRTRHAAQAVKNTAENSAMMTRLREDAAPQADGVVSGWGPKPPRSSGPPPRLGPVDLVGDDPSEAETLAGATSGRDGKGGSTFGDAFDDWVGTTATAQHADSSGGTVIMSRSPGVVDGAEAFADVYAASGPREGQGATAAGKVAADVERHAATITPDGAGGAGSAEPADGSEPADEDAAEEMVQTTLPGLAREPRQTGLPVIEPAYVLPEPAVLHKSTPLTSGQDNGQRDTASVLL